MKPLPYMISVQYGGGIHFFRGGALEQAKAHNEANKVFQQVWQAWKKINRGAKPRVMIWELKESIQDVSVEALNWNKI